jgi:hypothetical protein
MAQNVVLKAKGLYTHSNPLSAVPEGSLSEALNVVIDRNEIIEARRGFAQYGTTFGVGTDRTKQLINYKDTVLRHVLTNLQYDSDTAGTFLSFAGTSIVEIESGLRIKAIEANGNLYFVSSTGVKKLSARSAADFSAITIQEAGGVKALDLTAQTNYSSTGFLEANSKVAYRVVWGIKDLNENLILGSPSSRTVVYNVAATSCIVDLGFAIPADVQSTNYFYQIYRTGVFSATIGTEAPDPGEEMNLVFEDNVSSAQLTAGIVTTTDITPEDFRRNGALLYINPVSGEGIAQSNDKPPFAKDLALYKGYAFFANTKTVQRLNLSFLSVTGLTSNASTITITDGVQSNTYTFQGSTETYTITYTGTAHSDFVNVAPGPAKYFTLDSANNERSYYIWYYESVNDEDPLVSGKIGIKVTILGGDTVAQIITKTVTQMETDTDDFNLTIGGTVLTAVCANNGYVTASPTETISGSFAISKDGLGTGEDSAAKKIFLPRVPTGDEFGPTTSMQLEQAARSLVKVVNEQDNTVYAYYISGFNDVPGQILFERQTTTGIAFYLNSNAGTQFNPTLPTSGNSVISNNEIKPNRIYYSKFQQPEAVPLANYLDVGPQDREIKRIIALRDSLFIFKEDGIYRLSGDSAPFTVAPFDFSAQVLAPDTAVVLNNQIYALSTQGVIVVTDTGVSVISRPIENQLLSIVRQGYQYKTASFGVAYETDRSYLLFTVTTANDQVATQCFRYNTFTSSWTKWDVTKTCGIVNFADDQLYLGAGDENFIEKERKTLTRTDHADREYTLQVQLDGVTDETIELNSVSEVEIGDVLIQRQYLTALQFNRLLDKLDRDIGVTDTNYDALLHFEAGENMRTKLTDLATKLDADAGVAQTNFLTSIDNYAYAITGNTAASQTIITIGAHNIKVGRYVTIGGSNSTPSINGTYQVIAIGANTITIDKAVTVAGTTGTLQTTVNDFRDMQGCFNIIVNMLNTDSGAFYSNYPLSTSFVDFEVVILDMDDIENTVTIKIEQPFLFGEITLYKAIQTRVIWNPQFFQDPTTQKQVREGTMMFENSNFSLVKVSYSTDLSPAFEATEFEGQGIGDWGQFNWSEQNWGGVGAAIPLRTYVPRGKQRCRFMNVKFEHRVAFEKYSLYGMSLTFRPYSTRAYK